MHQIRLAEPADLEAWRTEARALLAKGVAPEDTAWVVGEAADDLLAGLAPKPAAAPVRVKVPRRFLDLAGTVICHSDPARFGLLYRLLWRLGSVPDLLEIAADPDVIQAERWQKAIRRDVHKMHAFVRFRESLLPGDDEPVYIAWFEPDHHIVERATPFFMRRFANMRWSILTPKGSAHWDKKTLRFGAATTKAEAPSEDALEAWWRVYYASIFNPARVSIKAMTAEMPRKYWKNMPETALIPALIAKASMRETDMLQALPTPPSERHQRTSIDHKTEAPSFEVKAADLAALRLAARGCDRCPLWRPATQIVFGEGPDDAKLCLVGEQPGDQEDLAGRPFVGPAGQVLDRALIEAGIEREKAYLTNAVKHFKHVPRGKRRLHQRPDTGEIERCRQWLAEEMRLLQPRLTVALGATAARALFGRTVTITKSRGRVSEGALGGDVLVTAHPSSILRLPDEAAKKAAFAQLVDDLKTARRHLEAA